MAKEVAISKRLKISSAQQQMLIAVFGASVFLGVAISLVMHFFDQISFNAKVIMAEDQSIAAYSNIIKNAGVCTSPSGSVYTDAELAKCQPENIDISQIPGTLRANILEKIAANDALNSVPKEEYENCINPATGKTYTYKELSEQYSKASSASELQSSSTLIKTCSALRVIPDALPAFRNEAALLAGLNKLFILSGWEPDSLSPSNSSSKTPLSSDLNAISVRLSVKASTATTMNVLSSIERSIREFDIERATIAWGSDNTLQLQAQATAYYMTKTGITETTKTIKAEAK